MPVTIMNERHEKHADTLALQRTIRSCAIKTELMSELLKKVMSVDN